MTEGISKERLKEILNTLQANAFIREHNLIVSLLNECTELDPWLPIDENTPKDIELIFKDKRGYNYIGSYDHISDCFINDCGYEIYATHYKLLPEDPKPHKQAVSE